MHPAYAVDDGMRERERKREREREREREAGEEGQRGGRGHQAGVRKRTTTHRVSPVPSAGHCHLVSHNVDRSITAEGTPHTHTHTRARTQTDRER